jgi:hypothetical protein
MKKRYGTKYCASQNRAARREGDPEGEEASGGINVLSLLKK